MSPRPAGKRERWQRLYDKLCDIMRGLGAEDAYGDGDFFIADDFYEGQQKVYITSLDMLARPFIGSISALVSGEFPELEVFVQISVKGPCDEPCAARASSSGRRASRTASTGRSCLRACVTSISAYCTSAPAQTNGSLVIPDGEAATSAAQPYPGSSAKRAEGSKCLAPSAILSCIPARRSAWNGLAGPG